MSEIPHPNATQHVIGHEHAIADFMTAWGAGRLHHAWLISGPKGIGKATLAYALARWVMAPNRPQSQLTLPPANPIVRQVMAGACPTLCVIEPEEDEKSGLLKEIKVDDARSIAPFLRMTAADDAWRVVLIDNADMMNPESQNAILKILEEPPARCLILLTAALPGRLLPTIRSRSSQLKLQPLPDNELRQLAQRLEVKLQGDRSWAMKYAAGSIGQLIHLAELDGGTLHEEIESIVRSLPHVNMAQVHKLAGTMARKEQDLQFRLALELINASLTERLMANPQAGALWDDVQVKLRVAPDRYMDRTATLIDVFSHAARLMQGLNTAA